jgi:hypothetical protein
METLVVMAVLAEEPIPFVTIRVNVLVVDTATVPKSRLLGEMVKETAGGESPVASATSGLRSAAASRRPSAPPSGPPSQ